ncbi:flippase [Parabacteroides johnsonii]|uniref:flippase n=1 Tax=Parabacteroides johnsonii TaxID=387661 RepID=UPI003AB27267
MIKTIKNRIKNSKDGKTVFANFGYLTLLQIAGYVFPLITMPYLARVIGADGFGKIAFAAAIVVWFQTIADWGFNFTATRDVAQCRDDKEKVSRIFSNVLWARCMLTFVSGLILVLLTLLIPSFRENWLIICLTFLMIPGHIFFPDWFFQAVEKMKYTTLLNLGLKLLFTIAVFVFIKDENDYLLQPVFTTLGYLLCGVCALYIIINKWGYIIYKPDFCQCLLTIKSSTNVFINNMVPNLYNSFSVMLLGQLGGTSATGIFDGGNKFISIVYQFQSVLSRVFFPFLSRKSDKISVFARINLLAASILAIGLFLFAPLIVRIMLTPEFIDSVIVLRILSLSFIFMALNNTYGQNYLIVTNHERELRNLTLFSSLIGMVISYPMVTQFSYIGAALTILISRIIIGVWAYSYYRKFNKTK